MHEIIEKRLARYRAFYASNSPGDLLIVNRPSWVSKKNLFEYNFDDHGHLEMASDLIDGAHKVLAMNGDMDDDLIPWLAADFGIAIHHAFLFDIPVQFAEWTSWAPHPLAGDNGYELLDDLAYDPDNKWLRMIKEMNAYWRDRADDLSLPITHGHYSPLDLANAVRGNAIFTDFYEYPDETRRLLEFCTEVTIKLEEDLRQHCGNTLHEIGMPFWGTLAPPDSVFISEDTMDLCGPRVSEEWGKPYTMRVRDHFGTLAIHHHMYGRNVHPLIGKETSGSLVQMTQDPNCPPPMTDLCALYADSGDNALMIDCSPDEIFEHKDELVNIRAILICNNGDVQRGKEAVELIRLISNIK